MSRRLSALLLLLLALLAGCGLPLPSGVQVPGPISPDDIQANRFQVVPPGPNPASLPRDVVTQFISAQQNGEGRHAIARQFLAPEVRADWDDTAGVQIYDVGKQDVQQPVSGGTADTVSVQVLGAATASIAADGSYDPGDGALLDTYKLRNDPVAGWQLTEVPPGLRLQPDGFAFTFAPREVYYLARGTAQAADHLAPDPAFLPTPGDQAEVLVRRLLAGPSKTLRDAVDSAVPPGAELRAATTDAAGLVTVDLGPAVAALSPGDRERLSAQLVWTLRGIPDFVQLRLLSAGRPVDLPGIEAGEPQPRDAWAGYDPDGLSDRAVAYYVSERRLRTVDGDVPPAATTPTGDVTVDLAAVSPRTNQLAVLTEMGEGAWEVRTGPVGGQLADRVYRQSSLGSPSWGSGRRGLWLLKGQSPEVLLLEGDRERVVPLDAPPPGFGRLVSLRVSRDGARIAMVAGDDAASQRAFVGTVEQLGADLRISEVRAVGTEVTEVSDVAWETGTSLVVLGRVGDLPLLPLRLSVDGSGEVDLVRLPGLERLTPTTLAAAGDRPLLVAATEGQQRLVLRDAGGVLARLVEGPFDGYVPFYPG